MSADDWKRVLRTFVLDSTLHAWLHGAAKRIPTDEFKILGDIVHLLPHYVRDNDINVIATMVVHSPQ